MPTYYAYIDESGDEGYPKFSPHTDVTAYRDDSQNRGGPSSFFMMCGALVLDTDRSSIQTAVRALSKRLHPGIVDREIHWRNLSYEKKEHAAEECAKLPFVWTAVVAYKPALKNALKPPLLYNYCTKYLLERLCIYADKRGGTVVPVFSNRSRTNYVDLQRYVSNQVIAFGAGTCLRPIRTQQPNKERLLQLIDVCAGTLQNALEVNSYGRLHVDFFRTAFPRLDRHTRTQKVWGTGLKFLPDNTGTNYGPATAWIDTVRSK